MRRILMWLVIAGLALVLGVTNYDIWQKQQIVENGQQILLQLRPVDPRSLMQGDFMQLRYAELDISSSLSGTTPHVEKCTQFQKEDDEHVIANTCDEAVVVVFMPRGQDATEFTLGPMERLATGMSYSAPYIFTTCPVGYVSSVPVRDGRRSFIGRSQYLCVDPTASRERSGTIVLTLDADNVGSFARLDDGSPLSENEAKLKYKLIMTAGEFSIGAESFFFQEGTAELYENAQYGVLQVDEDGASVLVGLADDRHQLIVPLQ